MPARQRSGQARDPQWRTGRYDTEHRAERARRLPVKHLLTCPRCKRSVAGVPDHLLVLDHHDEDPTRWLDGLAHQRCNAQAAAHNTNAKRKQQPYTRTRARATLLRTRAHGSTQTW